MTGEMEGPRSRFVEREVKQQPNIIPETKIVSAYGLRKCPKLVEQIASEDLEVRVNSLTVLCDELNNPYSVLSCAQSGVFPILAAMIIDPDYNTRKLSSRALAIGSKDACGLDFILRDDIISDILLGRSDSNHEVRENIFECLLNITRTADGVDACNIANATIIIVDSIKIETIAIKILLLKSLYNIVGSETGLLDALNNGAVEVCINLIKVNDLAQADAAKTLGFICFDERGKLNALQLQFNVIEILLNVLEQWNITNQLKGNILMAIMSITSTDEGKRQCYKEESIYTILKILTNNNNENNRIINLNILKVISNIAVYPPIRKLLLADSHCVSLLVKMKNDNSDSLLKRHAEVALNAVNWKP